MARLAAVAGFLVASTVAVAADDGSSAPATIRIGVVETLQGDGFSAAFQPTAEYLSRALPEYAFSIVPLRPGGLLRAAEQHDVDFVIASPAPYVDLEVRGLATRILTVVQHWGSERYDEIGGVVFTRAGRRDLTTLADLRGHTLAAIEGNSLMGWLAPLAAMRRAGLDPQRDLRAIRLLPTHDAVIAAVLAGEVDAGAVRTDVLEHRAAQGKVDLDALQVIDAKPPSIAFPFVRSTDLYPDWPLASVRGTPAALAHRVAAALLDAPPEALLRAPSGAALQVSWTIPQSYLLVHELLRELRIAPYENFGRVSLTDALRAYWPAVATALAVLALLGGLLGRVLRMNRDLERALAEQRRAEAQLREFSAQIEDLYDRAPCGYCSTDRSGGVLRINSTLLAWLGYRRDEVVGRLRLEDLVPDGRCAALDDALVRLRQRGDTCELELEICRKDRSRLIGLFSLTAVAEHGDAIDHLRASVFDITKRKEIENQLAQAHAELKESFRRSEVLAAMGALVGGVAHDLRNPLFGLSATLDAFAQSFGANADVAPYVEVLRRELARIEALATDLLAYGRPDAGELAPASLEPVLRAASASCGALAERQGVRLRVECALGDARVAMSRPRLERVFENLVQNAIQQSTRGGQVVLRAARGENGTALCTVEDEGPGFPADDLPRIFEPFFSRRRGGTGLGLAIAQRTIEHHHGRIGASNRPDGGAVISVHLPLA